MLEKVLLLGFLNSDKGSCSIGKYDCRKDAQNIQKDLGYLNIGYFIKLNLGLLLLHFALSSISFCSSCIFNESSKSLLFGAGIPALFFIIQMLASSGKKVSSLKYGTIFTLFNPSNIISGKSVLLNFVILFVIGVVLYTVGIFAFNKKDLPL